MHYFLIIGKMCFAAGWNSFAGGIWSVGRSVENPDIDYEEEWWQHTPLSESNTNAERLWFNSVDTDTIFWAGLQLHNGQKEALVDTYSHNTPKAFHEEPGHILSRGRQNMCIRLWLALRIFQKFAGEWKFGLQLYGRDEKRTGYHPALIQLLLPQYWHTLFLGG